MKFPRYQPGPQRPRFALVAALLAATTSHAAPTTLTLDQAIDSALRHNLGLLIASVDPALARDSLEQAGAAYDPELFASVNIAESDQAVTFSTTQGTRSDVRRAVAGVRQTLPTGTRVTAQTNWARRDSNAGVNLANLNHSADLAIELRQPLLRDFGGLQTKVRVLRAEYARDAADAQWQDAVLGLLADTEIAYWTLVIAQQRLDLRESSLAAARSLLDESRERERVGLATRLDVLQAEASHAARIEERIEAERLLEQAGDVLIRVIGSFSPDTALSDHALATTPVPADAPALPSFEHLWYRTLQSSPALRQQEATLLRLAADRRLAGSDLKPQVDLTLSGAWSGQDNAAARDAYAGALDRDGTQWGVGIEVSMPWGRTAAKAAVRAADRQLQREDWRLENLRQELLASLRAAWRDLQSAIQSGEAALATLTLQEARLVQERARRDAGLSTFRDLLDAERDRDQAQLRHLEALNRRIAAEIRVERLAGSLAARHGLQLPDAATSF
jgi:outer membrane protein